MSKPPSAFGYVRILIRLAKLLRKHKPDAVISHTHYAGVMGTAVAWWIGIRRRIAVMHNPVNTYPTAARYVDYFFGTAGVSTHIVAVSKTVADSLAHYPLPYRKRLSVIYNGLPSPANPPARDLTRQRYQIPLAATLLINVGRFSRQKNQDFLLRLLAKDARLHLLLVGDGELHAELHASTRELGLEDRVHFTGEVPADEVNALIACSDIFVLPSLFEAVGMVVLEAMALGVPIISSNIPSSHEFLGNDGFISDLASPDAWLESIHTIENDPELAEAMVRRAKLKVQAFTVSRMAESYESLMVAPEATARTDQD